MSLKSYIFCRSCRRNDDRRDAGLTTPAYIRRCDDILYGSDPRRQVLDVYRPAQEPGKLPVIVSIHGGGWVYGDKERYQYYCMSLAQRGFAVVNFTYRLAPKYRFPASLEDTNAVFCWVLQHAEEYGFDTEHIFAVGDSAGAHMLALYCCICTDPAYAAEYPFAPPRGFVPTAAALNCGVYEVRRDEKGRLNSDLLKELLPGRGTEEELHRICVLEHVNAAFPPSFIMTANGDFLKDQAPLMTRKLEELGVPAVSRVYGDDNARLEHVFHCNMRLPAAAACNDDECSFFRSFC